MHLLLSKGCCVVPKFLNPCYTLSYNNMGIVVVLESVVRHDSYWVW